MKKKIAMLLIAGCLLGMTACGETATEEEPVAEAAQEEAAEEATEAPTEAPEETPEETPEATEEPVEDDGVINFDGEGFNVTYVKHETGEDYEGNPCLYYYYTFTNNGEENASAAVTAYVQCFQNGVQCESAITLDENDSINNYMMEVQPGGSVEVCQVYSLSDTRDVTIEASNLISLDDSKDTQVISLS